MRGIWTGSISFGLVNVGVKALTAVRDHDVRFHQIDRESGSRIGYQKVSKETGKTVEPEDILMGYELTKNQYVTFERTEIDELKPDSSRVIEISDFVELEAIDPIYFNNTYWLAPTDEAATRSYALLVEAMKERGRAGIGTVVMRNKAYLAAIRVSDDALAMSTMRFADEVVGASDIADIPAKLEEPSKREMALATQIVDALASDWDPSQYHDTYTSDLRELIEKKSEGELVTASDEAPPESAKIVDLMEALQASVKAVKGDQKTKKKPAAKRPPAKKSASTRKKPESETKGTNRKSA